MPVLSVVQETVLLQDIDLWFLFASCLISSELFGPPSLVMLYCCTIVVLYCADRDKVGADADGIEEHRRRPRQQVAQGIYP